MSTLILVKHSLPEIVENVPAREWKLSAEGQARCKKLAISLAKFQPDQIISSVPNPLVSNPLVSNPLVSNSTVYDITDVTWTVQNGGNTNSAYFSQVALANALMHVKGYAAPEPKAAFEQVRSFIERAEALGESRI